MTDIVNIEILETVEQVLIPVPNDTFKYIRDSAYKIIDRVNELEKKHTSETQLLQNIHIAEIHELIDTVLKTRIIP